MTYNTTKKTAEAVIKLPVMKIAEERCRQKKVFIPMYSNTRDILCSILVSKDSICKSGKSYSVIIEYHQLYTTVTGLLQRWSQVTLHKIFLGRTIETHALKFVPENRNVLTNQFLQIVANMTPISFISNYIIFAFHRIFERPQPVLHCICRILKDLEKNLRSKYWVRS